MGLVAYRVGHAALRFLLGRASAAASVGACRLLLLIGLVAVPDPAVAQTFQSPQGPSLSQVNQTFNSQGPAPEIGNVFWIGSSDAAPNGTDAGAVQAVLLDPAMGAGTIFAGSPNGGVWKTINGGKTWTALTDNQASLSIGSLSLDPNDPSGKTIIAGIGLTDNGFYVGSTDPQTSGGQRTGLLYTTNGGTTWSTIGLSSPFPESAVSAMARGNTILAATYEVQAPTIATGGYGLFRSTDGGATFNNMSGAAGSRLPLGAVTSLVADPNNTTTFYAAVKNSASNSATAVYISRDTGATWTPIFTATNSNSIISSTDQTVITLAAGPNNSVAIALSDLEHPKAFTAVFLSGNQGATGTWKQLTAAPPVNSGDGQTPQNLHIAIDPTNKNIVYLSGDTSTNGVQLYRLNFDPNTNASSATSLTFDGLAINNFQDASTAHADSRSISFDQAGNLILSSDGGIYVRSNPHGAGSWSALNGNLSVFEIYSIAYDANSKRLAIAAQDNNTALQSAPGNNVFNTLGGGDGTNVAINDTTLPKLSVVNNDKTLAGLSAVYSSSENLGGLSRLIINAQGQVMSPGYDLVNAPGGIPVYCSLNGSGEQNCAGVVGGTFFAQFVLNKVDPTLIAIGGGGHVYTSQDSLSGTHGRNATSIDLALTDLGPTHGVPTAITYGTVNDNRAIAVGNGENGGAIWFSATNTTNSLIQLSTYGGNAPIGIVFDTRIQSRIFAVDGTDLYYTHNADMGAGATFATLTSNLPTGFITPASVEFVSNNGVNALLVGGLNQPTPCTPAPNGCVISPTQSPITVADSDSSGMVSNWRAFGQGLPNAIVEKMTYNPTVDVLAVSSIGRGAYVLYDVTSYFPQAQQLWFGRANNDSTPDATLYLNDGTVGSRPLIKYGTGLLTIAGDATYTGGTTINGGAVMLGTGGTSGSVKGNITFCSDPTDTWCDTSTKKMLGFNRSDVYAYNGSISGPGQVFQLGAGTTVMGGASTYTGPTYVNAGVLQAGGLNVFSPNSLYNVATAAALDLHGFDQTIGGLAGSGPVINDPAAIPTLTIVSGGTFAPGNGTAGSSMSVAANLAFQSGAFYLVQISGPAASFATVAGNAAPGGATVQANFSPSSGNISKQYTILTAAGGVSGTFASLAGANFPTTLTPNLSYDANDVFLNLALNYNALGNLNGNQQNVGNALANFFDRNGSIPVGYVGLSPAALSQAAGETATGSQQTTFQAMSQFLSTLLDPFIGGREGTAAQTPATPYAEDGNASAYAEKRKKLSDGERAAYAAVFTKAPLRQVYDPHWSVWASGFGGSQTTDGDAATGSNSATSRIFGVAAGADYLLSPRTIAGFALAGGGTNFSVANSGSGRSDLFQAGAYVRHSAGAAYVSAALAYGWQDVITDRQVMADKLHAEFNANALSGRAEGGYRVATRWMGITPYVAGQFTTFFLPSYAESAAFGSNAFALAYGSRSVTDTRSELGIRADRSFALLTGLLTLRGRLAWAHDFDPDRGIAATFQALPGASFVVGGAAQASESALTTASAEIKWRNGWSAVATFEGEFSKVATSFAGREVVRYVW
jgi:autotransporter-associated beta strand protein